jgi:carbonic anhydrase
MHRFVSGYRKFRREVFPHEAARYRSLALQQHPHTLFITCADSRIMPTSFTQTEPGDLFQCRVVGNIVPAHGNAAGGVTSSIEYAVMVLGVEHIIICGHSDCGAMRAFLHPEKLKELKAVQSWIEHADAAITMTKENYGHLAGDEFLAVLAKENIICQLHNLRTHPCVGSRLRRGTLQIHGFYYDIGEGTVEEYDEASGSFLPLDRPHRGEAAKIPEVA